MYIPRTRNLMPPRPAVLGLPPAAAGAALAALLALAAARLLRPGPKLPPEVMPFPAPLMRELPEFGEPYRSEMLWGSYRSGLYFGMRTR